MAERNVAEKNVGNRTISGTGRANGNADARPGQLNLGATGDGAVSARKNEPANAEPAPTPAP